MFFLFLFAGSQKLAMFTQLTDQLTGNEFVLRQSDKFQT